ncbi:MAG: energy-coupling factor transporter transmembrane protein EcfT, partial [Moritella sp.]|nr:energy-coupling factor transporter transmembrane protein EcfT [Moritella sp.]
MKSNTNRESHMNKNTNKNTFNSNKSSVNKTKKIDFGINYVNTNSALHQINGVTKFVLFLAWVTVVLT